MTQRKITVWYILIIAGVFVLIGILGGFFPACFFPATGIMPNQADFSNTQLWE